MGPTCFLNMEKGDFSDFRAHTQQTVIVSLMIVRRDEIILYIILLYI